MKWCVVEVQHEFDEDFDGDLCRVTKVLQVFDTEQAALEAEAIFNPMNYGDYETSIRVIPSHKLGTRFR
jgi:hypothetical protein